MILFYIVILFMDIPMINKSLPDHLFGAVILRPQEHPIEFRGSVSGKLFILFEKIHFNLSENFTLIVK